MQYNVVPEWGNLQVSRLGMGCMRLPTKKDGDKTVVDRPEAIELIRAAIDGGVNYIDTAYGYHGGQSELVTGEALLDGYRDRVSLATKLPSWLVKEEADMDRILDEQLKKLRTDHIDFYLLHAVNKSHIANYRKLGYQRFLDRAKADGRIGRACFSFHDDAATFLDILDDYDWAMCQVQFNYMDTDNQAGLSGIQAAGRKGVGVVVMEPIRGGALANPPETVKAMMEGYPVKRTPVEWAFAYVAQFPENRVLLSGMSNTQQLSENLKTFETLNEGPLPQAERDFIDEVTRAYRSRVYVGCTGCRYCAPCPQGVAIPDIFHNFDESYMFDNFGHFKWFYGECVEKGTDASKCVECGACEEQCPQKIPIIRRLAEIRERSA
ncbi:MAG: aldo/keto reductase [Oscillospiraceae bacterium]|nr:aldo/keto reductase [Oscillospiraceae bacterium]